MQCVCLTICAVILRSVSKRGYSPVQFSIDSLMIAGLIYFVLFMVSSPASITLDQIVIMSLAAGFFIIGSTF